MIGPKSMTDDARAVLTEAVEAGWTYQVRSNGHLLLHHPDGVHTVTMAASARHGRGARNARAQIRRHPIPTQEDAMPTVAELATITEPEDWQPARKGLGGAGDPYQWMEVNAAGAARCTHPGCGWSRHPGAGLQGLAQHEGKHTGAAHERTVKAAATRAANAKAHERALEAAQTRQAAKAHDRAPEPEPEALDDQRMVYMRAAVAALAEYFGLDLADRSEAAALRAQVDDLTAKLALIKEAAGL